MAETSASASTCPQQWGGHSWPPLSPAAHVWPHVRTWATCGSFGAPGVGLPGILVSWSLGAPVLGHLQLPHRLHLPRSHTCSRALGTHGAGWPVAPGLEHLNLLTCGPGRQDCGGARRGGRPTGFRPPPCPFHQSSKSHPCLPMHGFHCQLSLCTQPFLPLH